MHAWAPPRPSRASFDSAQIRSIPLLTKSHYLKGRQCARRLWLAVHGPREPAIDSDDLWEMREEDGRDVEELAESTFPGIVLIEDESTIALARTLELIAARRPIAQARFEVDGLSSITDILEPRDAGWFLWEVKASNSTYPVHEWDVAFQVEVARRAGLQIVGAGVIRLEKTYERGDTLDPAKLLVRDDRTASVESRAADVRREIDSQLEQLSRSAQPAAQPSSHCKANREATAGNRPSLCGHFGDDGVCGRELPRDWAGRLPRLSPKMWPRILAMSDPSIALLDADDADAGWTPNQERCIRAVQTNGPVIDAGALQEFLAGLQWPVAYVDFEFDPNMAVPRFPGCRPYDKLPFQWSMLVQDGPGGELRERGPFLHVSTSDPRAPFAAALLASLPSEGSIVAHHAAAESGVLKQLAERLGGRIADQLRAIVPRFFDTEKLALAGYCHPEQRGSWSLKKLAPALLGRGYDDLQIQDGLAAVAAWRKARHAQDTIEADELRRDLLAYCGRDTALMHAMIESLRQHAAGAR